MSAADFIAAADLLEAQDGLWKAWDAAPCGGTCTGLALLKSEPELGEVKLLLGVIGLDVSRLEDEDDPDREYELTWGALFSWNDRPETTLDEAVSALRRTAGLLP